MGRPSNELPGSETALIRLDLARGLRALRGRAQLTLRELSTSSGLSSGTLSNAEGGFVVPSERTITAFVLSCGERNTTHWLTRREAALREAALRREAPDPSERQQPYKPRDHRNRAWRTTWQRWDRTGKLTPPSHASASTSLAFWLEGLRAYRSLSYRSLARRTNYSHTTLAAMAQGFQPVTVPGLLAFLDGCRATTFAERIEWLGLLERTSSSPRRRLEAAKEQERLRRLGQPNDSRSQASSIPAQYEWSAPDRRARSRGRAVIVEPWLLRNELQALHRYYRDAFIPLLSRHTGIPQKLLRRYLAGEAGTLDTDHRNRLAAARVRIGTTPPPRGQLHLLLPPQISVQRNPGPSYMTSPSSS